MTKNVIIDTGVLVALIDKRDFCHEWVKHQIVSLPVPYKTCEAVVTEACHLLAHVSGGARQVLTFVERATIEIDFSLPGEIAVVKELIKKYENVPMDFADACLVRMSETIDNSIVFTLDSDFWVYRKNSKDAIELIIPANN